MADYQRIQVEYGEPVTRVRLVDSKILDQLLVKQLAEELVALVQEEKKQQLLLDMSEVTFLSSAALNNLVVLNKKVQAEEGKIVLVGLQPQVYEVFNITGLNRWFKIADSPESGLADFASLA